MKTIRGTAANRKEFVKWANKRNEKLLQFVVDDDGQFGENELRDIITLPDKIDTWLMFNCFLGFIKEHYCALHGSDYWKY